ncbi:MAG: SulP family inorganic anion transporter [Gammaproteobacteria bacterium]|nr:SulP family inorganic anion transporter [Gammaproteobacteria bacterium]
MSDTRKTVILGKEWLFGAGLKVGLVQGFTLAISLFALASIVFTGELEPFVLNGTTMFYVGTAILCVFLAILGKFPAPVATTPIPVALVMIAITQSLELDGRDLYLTSVISIVGCTFLSGLLFLGIGYVRAASFFRFIPFTISAGVLAGSGILVLLMALNLAGLDWRPSSWEKLIEPMAFWNATLSVLLGVVFIVVAKVWRLFWVLPALFVAFCVLFHIGLKLLGISIDEARAGGLFFSIDWSGALWPTYGFEDLSSVDWGAVFGQVSNAMVLFVILLILTVVNFSQVELGAKTGFDWDREFKLHGTANLLSGLGGGVPGATVASASLQNIALRANTPATSVVMAIVLLAVVLLGSDVLKLVPLPATSAFLISIAVPLITEWLINSRKRLQPTEFGMLLLICVTILVVGFLEAIVLGLILSLVFLIVRFSSVPLIKSSSTLRDRSSHKIRSIPDQTILKVYGSRAQVYQLQGYVFFGSAHTLTKRLIESLNSDVNPSCVMIDFEEVSGFDLSALDSFRSFIQRASAQNVQIVLCSTTDRLAQEIREDFPSALMKNVTWAESEEDALIKVEDVLLTNYENDVSSDPDLKNLVRLSTNSELTQYLDRQIHFENLVVDLNNWSETVDYEDKGAISTRGDSPRGLQLLIAGKASVLADDGSTIFECGAGSVIESASAIEEAESMVSINAEGACQTLLITPAALARLDAENNELALRLYKYVMSEKAAVS